MNKFLFSFLLLAVLSSCSKKYKIEGTSSVSSLDGKMLFLKVMGNDGMVNVDSAEVVHGNFTMNGEIDSVSMAMLYMDEESIMPLVLENGKMNICIAHTEQKVHGTPLNDKLYSFIFKKNELDGQIEELRRKEAKMIMNGEDPAAIQAKMVKESGKLSAEMNQYIKDFIIDNSENVLGPNVFIMLCNSFPYPVMTPQIEEIVNGASDTFKKNRLVQEYVNKARENMRLMQENHSHPAPPPF